MHERCGRKLTHHIDVVHVLRHLLALLLLLLLLLVVVGILSIRIVSTRAYIMVMSEVRLMLLMVVVGVGVTAHQEIVSVG